MRLGAGWLLALAVATASVPSLVSAQPADASTLTAAAAADGSQTQAPAPAPPNPAPFLWRVQVGQITHYLLGSVHLLPEAAHPLPAALERAYAHASTVVFESDLASLDAPDMQRAVLAAARLHGETLRDELSPALYERVQRHAREFGLPAEVCDPYAAWFCAMTFEIFSLQQGGFAASLGLDQHFFERASADNKQIDWFEAPAEHLKLFTEMSPKLAGSFLQATLDEDGDPRQEPEALFQAWRSGDVAYVEALDAQMKEEDPALYERLIAARNRAWMPNLSARLKSSEAQMIIVGAAHLVGPDGLVSALRNRGFDVRAVAPGADAAKPTPPVAATTSKAPPKPTP
ncbi:TraB/GumN family protein [Solimonas marina]|uniref:TraB/GumN family protein n=1 Tax=Solimonas marina TaxID=2714601 RepID=A0A969W6X1_9GAMM|nr:TraB/GumN family protein [Solimonas marina]NKF21058.1 TraB/GumN family protein [Solimonas marina]